MITGRRRELLEEVLEHRARVVASLPADVDEVGSGSVLWLQGAVRLATSATGQGAPLARRARVRDLAVMALAWLERIEEELEELR